MDSVEEVFVGKYGAVVVYEETSSDGSEPKELPEGIDLEKLPKQLCQHIIGKHIFLLLVFNNICVISFWITRLSFCS